jgi:Abortive infection alpha
MALSAKINVPADVTRGAVGFMQRILGPVAEASDFLSDKIRYFRFRSAVRTIERAREITEQSGIRPKEIPLKFLVPFFEECSYEEEDSPLVEQWARLLAEASKEFSSLHMAIKDVLKNISAAEAKIIEYLGTQIQETYFQDDIGAHDIIESSAGYARRALSDFITKLPELPGEREVEYLMGTFVEGKPILPLYCHLPSGHLGVSQLLESNVLHQQRGPLYLLERLGLVKSMEYRQQYSSHPDFPEFIFSWLQLTPFGLDIYQHCVQKSSQKKSKASSKKKKRSKPADAEI